MTSALIVFFGTTYFTLNAESFALFNVIMVGLWIVFSIFIVKEQKKLTPDALPFVEKV